MSLKIGRQSEISPFIVMDVMKAAADREVAGADVLHMEVGQPSTSAPVAVRDAAKAALDNNVLGYTLALGIEPLRQKLSDYYRDIYGLPVSKDNIAVTTGSSAGFLLSFLAAFDPGDRIGITRPGYPCYRNILNALGMVPVDIPVGPDGGFQPTVAGLDAAGGRDLAGILVASPANPTGSMLSADTLQALLDYCRRHDIRYLSDEIYHGISYNDPAVSALAFSRDAIVINSFSKYFSMTGWRLGWLVLPDDLVRPVERLAQNLFISAPTLSQHAAVAAFDCRPELDANVARYAENRALLLEALPKAGFHKLAPADGAFYIYVHVGHLTNDAVAFCKEMLETTGVAATPGNDFDPVDGHAYIRFSFAGATADMSEAANRLKDWLADRK